MENSNDEGKIRTNEEKYIDAYEKLLKDLEIIEFQNQIVDMYKTKLYSVIQSIDEIEIGDNEQEIENNKFLMSMSIISTLYINLTYNLLKLSMVKNYKSYSQTLLEEIMEQVNDNMNKLMKEVEGYEDEGQI